MKRQMSNWALFLCFAALTGASIAAVVWLYLKIANIGITVIWDMVPNYIDSRHYTIIMCLIGGLFVGIFHKFYGPYPESMADSVRRVKTTGTYRYKNLPVTVAAAFLSLFFGGAVGPESGLVCLLLGLCFWAMDQFGMAREKMEAMIGNNPYIPRGEVFREMARGLASPPSRIVYDKGKIIWKRSESVSAGVTAGIVGLIVYILLNRLLGAGLSVPHLEDTAMNALDRAGAILLIAVGIGAGYLFLIFKKLANLFFAKMRSKGLHVLNAVLGGLVLGVIGTIFPMTMFSGGNEIQAIQYEYLGYTPYLLILIGVIKLFLTNICIESGWRGGHFFPVIFSGLSIGYGFSVILGTSQVFSVVVVTGALLGTMLQQPFGALVLSLIFFPVRQAGWMVVASFVGGCLPVPQPLRINPDSKGFIYNMLHRKEQKKLPLK